MELRNKKGFITVYAMLAMMFFVVLVTTASITASRKLNLQKEANSELFKIYNDSIGDIDQTDKTTIPIYTQAQFEQIAQWLNDTNRVNEYIYINNQVYFLNKEIATPKTDDNGTPEDTSDDKIVCLKFILKTELWFKGQKNEGTDKNDIPYIPTTITTNYHEALKKIKEMNKDYKQGHKIYLKVDSEEDEIKLYDETISIASAEDFIKIGTGKDIAGYEATPNQNYIIEKTIELGEFLDEIYSENSEKNSKLRNIWENRPDFLGTIKGKDENEIIINGLEIDVAKGIYGIFKTNSGAIEDLVFTDVKVSNSAEIDSDINLGIIAQTQSNTGTISNCNIYFSNQQTEENLITCGSNSLSLRECWSNSRNKWRNNI